MHGRTHARGWGNAGVYAHERYALPGGNHGRNRVAPPIENNRRLLFLLLAARIALLGLNAILNLGNSTNEAVLADGLLGHESPPCVRIL